MKRQAKKSQSEEDRLRRIIKIAYDEITWSHENCNDPDPKVRLSIERAIKILEFEIPPFDWE